METGATTLPETASTVGSFRTLLMVVAAASSAGKTTLVNRSVGEEETRANIFAASSGGAETFWSGPAKYAPAGMPFIGASSTNSILKEGQLFKKQCVPSLFKE